MTVLAQLGLLLLVGQNVAPRASDTIADHVVVSGETLSEITESYLGTSHLWRENWRLNPHIRDPDVLRIGDVLRIITHRELPARTAEVMRVRNLVEKKPPESWDRSYEGDVLGKDQSLRTRERASASIRFDDDTLLHLKSETLVVFKEIGQSLRGVRSETIEISQGTADLTAQPRRAGSSDIKIVVGSATTQVETGRTGRSVSRLRRAGEDSSEVMAYEGSARIASGGAEVVVPAGMGTSVTDGEAPREPERLLPRPALRSPAAGARFGYSNPVLTWEGVDGAATYAIEICDDAECKGRLVAAARGLTSTEFRPDELPGETLYWRVRGVAPGGLDGFASRPRSLVVEDPSPDLEPPVIDIQIDARGRWQEAGVVALLAPGGALRVAVTDDQSGPARIEARWSDGPWRELRDGRVEPPTPADHTLFVRARDIAGRSREVSLRVDLLEPPRAPTLSRRGAPVAPAATAPPG